MKNIGITWDERTLDGGMTAPLQVMRAKPLAGLALRIAEASMSGSHIERLIPRAQREVWQALIQDAELTERGALLRLVLSGELCESAAQITRYETLMLLECYCDGKLLRWQLEPRDENTTRLIFTERSA